MLTKSHIAEGAVLVDECWVMPTLEELDQQAATQTKKILMFCTHTWDRKLGCRIVHKGASRTHSGLTDS